MTSVHSSIPGWDLRLELLTFAQRWPLIALFILLGSAITGSLAAILPSGYEAEAGLHVSFNPDIVARNPDDFKNWQISELEIFIYSAPVLEGTLTRLRSSNSIWNEYSAADIQDLVHAYWRNAGQWRLVGKAQTANQARELAEAWRDEILSEIGTAMLAARELPPLNAQIVTLAGQQSFLRQRNLDLTYTLKAVEDWQERLAERPPAQTLTDQERWQIAALVARARVITEPIAAEMAEPNQDDQNPQVYARWLVQAEPALRQTQVTLIQKIEDLDFQLSALTAAYIENVENARGLTANAYIEPLGEEILVQAARSIPAALFFGALLGLLAWIVVWLVHPLRERVG